MTAPSIRSTHTGHTVATTATSSNITSSSMIQQRRTDPLVFGGSDALWDTISKGQGGDATVEKIISNFLRRGGSPNTAKQSPTSSTYPAVKYGYGMIHALIVTKAPISLELLLQQGANPDVVSLGQSEEDKVSPCYLAASVGWLTGLQKLIAFGGDLISARGAGSLKKTALHVAAEHGHAAVTEYIINMTQGVLNLETDSLGATVLHYACVSGHTDLVSFIINVCEVPLDRADCKGDWPIHYAARHGRFEVVILLVEKYRCDINAYTPTSTGTPYDIAKSCGHKRLVEYIKSNGGVTAKKMEKRREEEMSQKIPAHLQSALAKNGLMSSF
ncbi:ankyrin repeat-containing domain protein [Mycotypha africana]|uniref:ankyrin repeat-containing domain protein n=1 Tax=Mycotypha africana TaxID=64632 RepID=UPI0023013668|nr:ankyrin repeat-containing domain protein [Mycotypha africana]KAI8970035.1 ankyrin repeat-containing domain protein [Mycotypha africana]